MPIAWNTTRKCKNAPRRVEYNFPIRRRNKAKGWVLAQVLARVWAAWEEWDHAVDAKG